MKSYKESSLSLNESDLEDLSMIEENRGKKWSKFLGLCLALIKTTDEAVFEVNSKIMS